MDIVLSDEMPVSTKPRRMSNSEKLIVDKQIEEWLEENIIQASCSEFAANLVPVPKKDGTKRICIDFRSLNKKIIRDRFPMPVLEDQLDRLQSGKFFTTIDLANGFLQVPIKEESRKYTSFGTHNGQYEFTRVPFGLCNSFVIFCRFINLIFQPLIAKKNMLTYMDDMIIIAENET